MGAWRFRWGRLRPEELAGLYLYLAGGEASSYMTGSDIVIDGGHLPLNVTERHIGRPNRACTPGGAQPIASGFATSLAMINSSFNSDSRPATATAYACLGTHQVRPALRGMRTPPVQARLPAASAQPGHRW